MSRLQTSVYWVLAGVYLVTMLWSPWPFEWVAKAAPIWALAVFVVATGAFPWQRLVLVAILLGSLGDVLLELGWFLGGLAAFLLAQLCYAFLFSRCFQWRPERLGWAVFLGVWALAVLIWVWSGLGDMKIPVLAYLAAISLMGLAAVFSRHALWPGVLGAATFILSDSLIAIGLFVAPLPAHDWAVMLSYYGAQWMIVQALLLWSAD